MKLTWGKPKITFGKVDGSAEPTWKTMPVQKEDTVILRTEKQAAQELYGEGHELVARKSKKANFYLDMEVFIANGAERPIPDEDGVIEDFYAVRLLPENETLTGFQFVKAQVEVEEMWSSAEGTKVKYTFAALQPESGAKYRTYTKDQAWA